MTPNSGTNDKKWSYNRITIIGSFGRVSLIHNIPIQTLFSSVWCILSMPNIKLLVKKPSKIYIAKENGFHIHLPKDNHSVFMIIIVSWIWPISNPWIPTWRVIALFQPVVSCFIWRISVSEISRWMSCTKHPISTVL